MRFLVSSSHKQGGFTLVELMVVVAVTGILATIGVNGYKGFVEKAKITKAKSQLAQIYSAEKIFYAEYTVYSSRFDQMGSTFEGRLSFNFGFIVDNYVANLSAPRGTMGCRTTCGISTTNISIDTACFAIDRNMCATDALFGLDSRIDSFSNERNFLVQAHARFDSDPNRGITLTMDNNKTITFDDTPASE